MSVTARSHPQISSSAGLGFPARVRSAGRAFGSLVAGLATIVVLSTGTDVLLESTGVFPSVADQQQNGFSTGWMLALALAYRTVFVLLGAAVTARLAGPHAGPALVGLAVLGVGLGSAGAAAQAVTPLWFSLALVALGPPSVWAGGRLARSATRQRSPLGPQ